MSFRIHRHLDKATLQKRLTKEFQIHFRDRDFVAGDFVLISFSGQHPVLSKQVRKVLNELQDLTEPNRIVVGHNFTREGFELLTAQGFRAFCERDYIWTDESLKSTNCLSVDLRRYARRPAA